MTRSARLGVVLTLAWTGACRGRAPDADGCPSDAAAVPLPDLTAPVDLLDVTLVPADLDPASDVYPESRHRLFVATDDEVEVRDELFVMLPGTSNRGDGFERLGEIAARLGFPTLVLAYDSDSHPAGICRLETDPAAIDLCRAEVMEEKAYGEDVSAGYAIDEADSVLGRALRVLRRVDEERPELGADRWIDGDDLAWDRIVLGGFSQGAMMTGWIAKDKPLARAVLLAGGCDAFTVPGDDDTIVLADWCHDPRVTPVERTWALAHLEDEPEETELFLDVLGLGTFDTAVDVDAGAPPSCASSHLMTTAGPSKDGGTKVHLSVAHDDYVHLDADGVPTLAPAWAHALTAP